MVQNWLKKGQVITRKWGLNLNQFDSSDKELKSNLMHAHTLTQYCEIGYRRDHARLVADSTNVHTLIAALNIVDFQHTNFLADIREGPINAQRYTVMWPGDAGSGVDVIVYLTL